MLIADGAKLAAIGEECAAFELPPELFLLPLKARQPVRQQARAQRWLD